MKQDIRSQKLLFVGILAVVLLLINSCLNFRNLQKLYADTTWVIHTHKVIETVNNITFLTITAGAMQRGYSITGDQRYLEHYNSTFPVIFEQFNLLENLLGDNPAQMFRANHLRTIVDQRLNILNENLFLIKQKGLNNARNDVVTSLGNMSLDGLREQVNEIVGVENKLVEVRTQHLEEIHYNALYTSLLSNFISIAMVGAFCFLLRLYLINREKNIAGLMRLASIVDSSEDAIISKNLDGNITSWNNGAQKLFGYTTKEVINQSILILIPPDRIDEETMIFKQIYRGERINPYETVRRHKDGSLIEVSICVSPIKDSRNITIGASKIARDITLQHKLETALRDSENRFRKLSENLAKSNKELEQFAFIAAHDLKEPLVMIQSFADFLSRRAAGKLEKKERDYLDSIKEATVQAQTLIKDLLEFSRIGKDDKLQVMPLNKTIDTVKANLKMLIENSDASIACDECLPHIKCLPTEMVQLFQNLIENAIKYRSSDQLKIHISAVGIKNFMWLLAVRDNGAGIPSENAERIFNIFERGSVNSSGTGIGLAICRRIVENYGGKIWVKSEVGRGSTFFFTIPRLNKTLVGLS